MSKGQGNLLAYELALFRHRDTKWNPLLRRSGLPAWCENRGMK
jgi:hypothetical protein